MSSTLTCLPAAPPLRGAVALVDLEAVRRNLAAVRARLRAGVGICGVVKADAYGHGLVPVALALATAGVERLAIGSAPEAEALRAAGIELPLLRLVPAHDEELIAGLAHEVEELIVSVGQARRLSEAAVATGRRVRVHVDVDTGMGREGFLADQAVEAITEIAALPGLVLAGVMTHFPDAEDEAAPCARQAAQLYAIAESVRLRGIAVPAVHMANSAAALWLPETHGDFVRVGLALYGHSPNPARPRQPDLQPALHVRCPVVAVRDLPRGATVGYRRAHVLPRPTRVATLAIGYGDGYPRAASDRARVLLRGVSAPVIGIVSMNMVTVDASACPEVREGDTATVLGSDGEAVVTAHELARCCATIPYEITCRFGRLPRVYADAGSGGG